MKAVLSTVLLERIKQENLLQQLYRYRTNAVSNCDAEEIKEADREIKETKTRINRLTQIGRHYSLRRFVQYQALFNSYFSQEAA